MDLHFDWTINWSTIFVFLGGAATFFAGVVKICIRLDRIENKLGMINDEQKTESNDRRNDRRRFFPDGML